MKENRTALWGLLGVIVGFSLPILACVGLTLVFTLSLAAASSSGAQTTPYAVRQISGPPAGPAVALIEISGQIVSGQSSAFGATTEAASGDIIPLIHQAAVDSDVRSIVLLVNSPGGSVVPSDEIYHELLNLKIPVVVLMGDVAASGAFYISMAADQIIANPNTLTGSIGVISTFPAINELLDKLGVDITTIVSGDAKDFGSLYRPMTPEEVEYWKSMINEIYEGFVQVVADGRGLNPSAVREFADGRVFSGRQALELGLVDELGYQEDAIRVAAELGDISGQPRVISYQKFSPLASLLGQSLSFQGAGLPADWVKRILGPTLEYRWQP